jgi:hypothetical protein
LRRNHPLGLSLRLVGLLTFVTGPAGGSRDLCSKCRETLMATVIIKVRGPEAQIDAPPNVALREVLADLLTADLRRFSPGGDLGHQQRRSRSRFYEIGSDGFVYTLQGLVGPVAAELRRRGHQVEVRHAEIVNSQPRWLVEQGLAAQLPEYERPLVGALDVRWSGLLEVRHARDVARAVEVLARYHPAARLLVAATRKSEVHDLYLRLHSALGEQVATVKRWEWGGKHRILVASPTLVDVCNAADWEVIVYADALQAAVPSHVRALARLRHRRVFGCLRPGRRYGRHTELTLLDGFGPVLYRFGERARPAAPVRVLTFHPPCSRPCPKEACPLDRKRSANWHNDARNQALSEVARAFREGQQETLWGHGLLLGGGPGLPGDNRPPSVTVLVECAEHGRRLLARLPGWRLEAALPDGACPGGRGAGGWKRPLDGAVLTQTAAARLRAVVTDVLVRAEGGPWPLALPGLRRPGGGEVLLIDALDDGDAPAAAATRARLRDYAARVWAVEAPAQWLGQGPTGTSLLDY